MSGKAAQILELLDRALKTKVPLTQEEIKEIIQYIEQTTEGCIENQQVRQNTSFHKP